nr:hypothetical protein Itr_chr13CG16140 [Ipomoea trifida]
MPNLWLCASRNQLEGLVSTVTNLCEPIWPAVSPQAANQVKSNSVNYTFKVVAMGESGSRNSNQDLKMQLDEWASYKRSNDIGQISNSSDKGHGELQNKLSNYFKIQNGRSRFEELQRSMDSMNAGTVNDACDAHSDTVNSVDVDNIGNNVSMKILKSHNGALENFG